jgi:hypothetical protein
VCILAKIMKCDKLDDNALECTGHLRQHRPEAGTHQGLLRRRLPLGCHGGLRRRSPDHGTALRQIAVHTPCTLGQRTDDQRCQRHTHVCTQADGTFVCFQMRKACPKDKNRQASPPSKRQASPPRVCRQCAFANAIARSEKTYDRASRGSVTIREWLE